MANPPITVFGMGRQKEKFKVILSDKVGANLDYNETLSQKINMKI